MTIDNVVFCAFLMFICVFPVMRAIGVPTRSVTNFESAHDCDSSMTIDNHFDCEGESLDEKNDSVW